MRNAFLVSDDDLRSLRTSPWTIEMNGQAVFIHESILKIYERLAQAGPSAIRQMTQVPSSQVPSQGSQVPSNRQNYRNLPPPANGRLAMYCDVPNCPKAQRPYYSLQALNSHKAFGHRIPGLYHDKKIGKARREQLQREKQLAISVHDGLPPPSAPTKPKKKYKTYKRVKVDKRLKRNGGGWWMKQHQRKLAKGRKKAMAARKAA